MWPDEEMDLHKQDLSLTSPLVNTPGTLGFTPNLRRSPFVEKLGAFITNPISRRPRHPASDRSYLPFQGGYLMHTGLPNPGISRVVTRFKRRWASAPLPVIVYLLVESPETLAEMVLKLEELENILAVELGLPLDCDAARLTVFCEAAAGELPVIVSLIPEQIPVLLKSIQSQAPAAVHLTHPRGTLAGPDGALITGRLFGPATFPIMLQGVQTLLSAGLPVIASGCITSRQQVDTMLKMGVMAVGLDSTLWQVGPTEIASLSSRSQVE